MATPDAAPRPRHWSLPAEPPRTASAWTPVTDGDRAAVDPNGTSTLVATPEALGITSADVLLGEQHVLSDPPWVPGALRTELELDSRARPSTAGGGQRVATTACGITACGVK